MAEWVEVLIKRTGDSKAVATQTLRDFRIWWSFNDDDEAEEWKCKHLSREREDNVEAFIRGCGAPNVRKHSATQLWKIMKKDFPGFKPVKKD